MAKVLHEIDACESTHLLLPPSLRPCPLALADRDRRAKLEPSDLTAWFFGDPLPGMSALDLRRRNERTPLKSNFETAGQKEISVAVGATQ
jgi:hypothetical protein